MNKLTKLINTSIKTYNKYQTKQQVLGLFQKTKQDDSIDYKFIVTTFINEYNKIDD